MHDLQPFTVLVDALGYLFQSFACCYQVIRYIGCLIDDGREQAGVIEKTMDGFYE